MKATYDKEADAMYIRLKGGKVKKTLRVSDAVHVDVDKAGHALGVEFLFVSSKLPNGDMQKTIRSGIPVSLVAV